MALKRIEQGRGPGRMSSGLEASGTMDFIKGGILVASSGTLAEGAAGASMTAGTIVGVAETPASGTANTAILYIEATPDQEFEGTLGTSVTSLQSHLYSNYGFGLSSGIFYIDTTDTTNVRCVVTAFIDPVGTVDARVLFRFLADATIYLYST